MEAGNGSSHYVNIQLNPIGVAFLNNNLGNEVVFGGAVTGEPNGNSVQLFGYTDGYPAAELTASEPGTMFLLLPALGALGLLRRRRS